MKKLFSSPFGLFLLLTLLGAGLFLGRLSFPDSSYNFLGKSQRVEMTSGAPVTQIFTARENNLEGVKINVEENDLWPRETVGFQLLDATCQQEVAHSTLSVWTPEYLIFYYFAFPRIENSAGKNYCLSITYHSPYKKKDRPIIYASEGGPFVGISYTDFGKNRTYENRSLQIRPSYGEVSLGGRFQQLENRLSQYKPAFIKGYMLPLSVLTVLMTVFLAYYLWRSTEEE